MNKLNQVNLPDSRWAKRSLFQNHLSVSSKTQECVRTFLQPRSLGRKCFITWTGFFQNQDFSAWVLRTFWAGWFCTQGATCLPGCPAVSLTLTHLMSVSSIPTPPPPPPISFSFGDFCSTEIFFFFLTQSISLIQFKSSHIVLFLWSYLMAYRYPHHWQWKQSPNCWTTRVLDYFVFNLCYSETKFQLCCLWG